MQHSDERLRECEVERDTDADHRYGVEQRDDKKHLRSQHRRELRLPCGTLEEATSQEAHANPDAEAAEADHNRRGNGGHCDHKFH